MTDKVQKILNEIQTRKLCTMDKHMAFYSKEAEADYRLLCEIEEYIKSMQEEPVSEDLEQKALSLFPVIMADKPFTELDLNEEKRRIYKAGANWQKKQGQETIELAEDHAMLAGMVKGKEEAITKACKYLQEHREEVETEDNGISGWISDEFIEKFRNEMGVSYE